MSSMIDHTRNPVWGQILRHKVAESGLSQRAFAERYGFVSRTFNSWCNGRWPGEKTAREVAAALNLEYAEMVADRPQGADVEMMKTAIRVVDDRSRGMNLSIETRATLYTLAYQFMASHQSHRELTRHVSDLLALSGGQPSIPG